MELKLHYFMTFIALLFLAVIVVKPEKLQQYDEENCVSLSEMNCSFQSSSFK